MQIEAFYEDGRLEFAQPVQLKPGPVRVIIEIPDDQLVASAPASRAFASPPAEPPPAEQRPAASTVRPAAAASPGSLREAIDAILAPYADQLTPREPLSAPEAKAVWHAHLEAKHLDRG
ncbi:hypothetical protein [Halochromatium glycolicum]|uniref:Uncharacterized protein n=1 Tax=Halochromatium glycolicum TaxID=85075 RepID=A0AAJ0U4K1_9GAMM|nr:hypothetical protein [Halochromatium glycolicum]MBK1705107.1 hypothetical protein [Halochromatium glycolicum]